MMTEKYKKNMNSNETDCNVNRLCTTSVQRGMIIDYMVAVDKSGLSYVRLF